MKKEGSSTTDKNLRGNAAQFFVAGELSRRNISAAVTVGNTVHTDILCSNREATRSAHIQVKTFRPRDRTCAVGMKAVNRYGKSFFWVLVCLPLPEQAGIPNEYYIIPAHVMSLNVSQGHEKWLLGIGRDGRKRKDKKKSRVVDIPPRVGICGWDISKYKNKWSIIENYLNQA